MKKNKQLGMDAGTASYRLMKDLLFKFVTDAGHLCHRCQKPLTRADFTADHIVAWLDSPNPIELFFDLKNIAFSHLACNIRHRRIRRWKYASQEEADAAEKIKKKKHWTSERRRAHYLKTGN